MWNISDNLRHKAQAKLGFESTIERVDCNCLGVCVCKCSKRIGRRNIEVDDSSLEVGRFDRERKTCSELLLLWVVFRRLDVFSRDLNLLAELLDALTDFLADSVVRGLLSFLFFDCLGLLDYLLSLLCSLFGLQKVSSQLLNLNIARTELFSYLEQLLGVAVSFLNKFGDYAACCIVLVQGVGQLFARLLQILS